MSAVIAVRVPKKLKDEIRELEVDYTADVRECLEKKVKAKKLKKMMKEIDAFRSALGKKTGISKSAVDLFQEDRNHGH